MKNSKTPKIVVGVGLAAVYAAALAAFMPRDAHDNVVAQGASAAISTQGAPDVAASPVIVPESADALPSAGELSAPTTAAATPVASIPVKTSNVPPTSRESAAKSQGEERQVAGVTTASRTYEIEVEEPIPASEGNSAGEGALIAAEGNTQTAAAASDGAIDVTTNSEAVEPTVALSSQQ
jgi:hypothetical protein